jgi:hypothetical protein
VLEAWTVGLENTVRERNKGIRGVAEGKFGALVDVSVVEWIECYILKKVLTSEYI